jgi:hypothetical protein
MKPELTNTEGPSETTAEQKIETRLQDLCGTLDIIHSDHVRYPTCESQLERGRQAIRAFYKQMAEECERYEVIQPTRDKDWQKAIVVSLPPDGFCG